MKAMSKDRFYRRFCVSLFVTTEGLTYRAAPDERYWKRKAL